jgi:hypothetical protein
MKNAKVLIEWNFYSKEKKAHVTEWLPGELIHTNSDGTMHVKANNGFEAMYAAPECVKLVPTI